MKTKLILVAALLVAVVAPSSSQAQSAFTKITTGAIVTDGGSSYSCAWGDYDNDGFIDLAVANAWGQDNFLYRNNGNANGWLLLKLVGSISSRSAIGAKVSVQAISQGKRIRQIREVSGSGHNDLRAHFGLGDATVAETLRIEWPSGIVQELTNVAARQILTIVEPPRLRAVESGRVQVQGARDIDYAVEVSNDLTAWAGAGLVKGGAEFVDPDAGSHTVRYYRALVPVQ